MGDEINFQRYFVDSNKRPEDYFSWTDKEEKIKNSNGEIIYQGTVEVPTTWDEMAIKIVGSKYLYRGDERGKPTENSIKQLVYRVTDTLSEQALKQGILTEEESKIFNNELSYLVFDQDVSYNSPVWFNVGLYNKYGITEKLDTGVSSHWAMNERGEFTNKIDAYERPQAAACFIQPIEDNMESILNHAKNEGMLFKFGSGTGTNFSNLRGINEPISGGGIASGALSFLRIYDIIAGSIQSGGKTRRAAKMVVLNDDHPDIIRFINWKVNEERKALYMCANPEWAPRNPADLDSEAYKTVDGQNGNNTVMITDKYMDAVLTDSDWNLVLRSGKKIKEEKEIPLNEYLDNRRISDKRFIKKLTNKNKTVDAKEMFEQIVRAAYVVGDPALQFYDTINKWHTCPNSGPINSSNPCSEFMFIDNTACNLASLNLMKFTSDNNLLDINAFENAVKTTIIGQETLVDYGSYPSKEIAENSHKFRPLGLGYTNLGALLMSKGIAYDSDEGRSIASAITSLMTAKAYETSADLAAKLGAFEEFDKNKESMLNVIGMHIQETEKIKPISGLEEILEETKKVWTSALEKGKKYGFRNAQTTLLAPTGTIGFMLGVDCTGIEPMIGLKTAKGLAGGGQLSRNVSKCVELGLKSLGYKEKDLEEIINYVDENSTIIGAPKLSKGYYNVFQTALGKENYITVDGHLKMMAAVQPFLSGAISKTVNLPKGSSIQDVKDTYIKAWELGLKSICLFVDGAKGVQPVNIIEKNNLKNKLEWGQRDKPGSPIERYGINVNIGETGVHVLIGEYKNRSPKDSPADFFVNFGSAGSPFAALCTSWGKEASRSRQRGESLEEFIKHNLGANGVINGFTDHPYIKSCSSIEDFVAKVIMLEYLGDTSRCDVKPTADEMENLRCNVLAKRRRQDHFESRIKFIDKIMNEGKVTEIKPLYEDTAESGTISAHEVYCRICGHPTVLSGANCRKCNNCGDASGCG
ncbi:MAG: vitamin B12-dependent ribonucleotide reductase [Candidatus Nanoarchaeia archaeon]|nr:vitamin B12-dependent ribonucleotide reductase [Candidatus Nanoarchaeia archaeon]